jgi:hypothetical protein
MNKALSSVFAIVTALLLSTSANASAPIFSTDFNSSLPIEISPGVATQTGVQGYAGYGPVGDQFGGDFLRSPTGNTVTLTLTGLSSHTSLSLEFLFAAIDSLDGTGSFPEGDFFRVDLDGVTIFRESFANATPSQIQSYIPPTGVELAHRIDLGFSGPGGFFTDSAYNMGLDPTFQNIAHTGSTATFTFIIEGPGIQPLDDESWAMDNLRVSVSPVPEPETYALFMAGLGLMGFVARRRKNDQS